MTTPWTPTPEWRGETCAILASGPSMRREDAEAVRGKMRVIAVNNQGIDTVDSSTGMLVPAFAPWADVLYAADAKWWHQYKDRALKFQGRKVSISSVNYPQVCGVRLSQEPTFDKRPGHLANGGNSGYQAVHLAVHLGVRRIILLGFDMKLGQGKRRHWFGNHPGRLNSHGKFQGWIAAFGRLSKELSKRNVEVINCSRDTALRCFKRGQLEVVLDGLRSGPAATSGDVPEAHRPAGPGDGRNNACLG